MKCIALLNWYDESPLWLAATIASLASVCEHVVAIDGAYELYPGGRPRSGAEQAEAIVQTAHGAGLGLTLHQPHAVYQGNEIEKRNLLVQLAMQVAEVGVDWLFRIDADEVVRKVPFDLHKRLAETPFNVGECTLGTRLDLYQPSIAETARTMPIRGEWEQQNLRFLYRAMPGLHIAVNHYTYMTGDGVRLSEPRDADAGDFTDLKLEHRHHFRSRDRDEHAQAYYERRNALAIEGV